MVPYAAMPPPIVEEHGKSVHDKMVRIVREELGKKDAIVIHGGERAVIEYSVKPEWSDKPVTLVLKPDLYVLLETSIGPVNVAIEVTTRYYTHIPVEWLTAYNLGLYIRNLRPTLTMLVTPEQLCFLPLTKEHVRKLKHLIDKGPNRKPTPSLCYNCDLRGTCPSPLV